MKGRTGCRFRRKNKILKRKLFEHRTERSHQIGTAFRKEKCRVLSNVHTAMAVCCSVMQTKRSLCLLHFLVFECILILQLSLMPYGIHTMLLYFISILRVAKICDQDGARDRASPGSRARRGGGRGHARTSSSGGSGVRGETPRGAA